MNLYFLPVSQVPVAVAARLSGRSRSSFYYKPKKPKKDERLLSIILPIHDAHPFYGSKSVARDLKQNHGVVINHKSVARIMRKYGIYSNRKCKKSHKNQYSYPKESRPNKLKELVSLKPGEVWVGDFTHFSFRHRVIYLATVMDACTRQVLGWHIATNHSVNLVIEALNMGICRRPQNIPNLFHSDHGSEYLSEQFLEKLSKHRITPSNSGKGKPWQNGIQESFYRTFKEEFGNPNRFKDIPELIEGIGKHLKDYNTRRIHSTLRMSPDAFCAMKTKELAQQKTA